MRTALGLALMGIGVWATSDAWRDIARIAFSDEESSHILLVPVAMVWIAWAYRDRLKDYRRSGLAIGPLAVLIGGGLYLYGALGWARTVTYVGAILVVLGCLLAVVGGQVLRRFWPVFLALVFLIPVPGVLRQQIAVPLGTWTAKVTEHLLLLLNVPVERSGNLLSVNQVDVTIAEACNGLRMVLSLFFVSYVVAFDRPFKWYNRVLILLGAPALAVICNVIRLVPTLYLYGYSSADWAERFHDAAGWAMLGVAYFALIGLIRLVEWSVESSGTKVAARA